MPSTVRPRASLIPTAPLLLTESRDEFNRIRDSLNDQIKPRGIIEQMYVEDIAYFVWEMIRLRRSKAAVINSAFRAALQELTMQLLVKPGGSIFDVKGDAERLARKWFSHPEVKDEVSRLLREFDLDETAIAAEAFRRSADDLEVIDRLMARRNRPAFFLRAPQASRMTALRLPDLGTPPRG